MKRIYPPRYGVTVALTIALLLAAIVPATPIVARQDDPQLDLAAMTLRPADLAAEGKPNLGVDFGMITDDPADLAAWPGEHEWDEWGTDEEAFRAFGFERGYLLQLADIQPDPNLPLYNELLPTFVLEYESAAAAEEGFLAAAAAWDNENQSEHTLNDQALGIGDASLVWTGLGLASPDAPDAFNRAQILFRTGNLVGGIIQLDYSRSSTSSVEQMVTLAALQLDRMEDVVDRGGPGLSNTILRLDVEVPFMRYDRYTRIDDVTSCVAGEIQSCIDQEVGQINTGTVHRYFANQRIVGHFNDGEVTSGYAVTISAVRDEERAKWLLLLYSDNYADLPQLPEFDPGMVPVLGDRSTAGMHELSSGRQQYAVAFQTGSVVVQVMYYIYNAPISSQPAVVETMNAMAAWQLACLEGTASCADPVPLPAGFIEGGTPLAWEGAPAAGTLEDAPGVISPAEFVDIVSDRD